ncbi:MAG: BlaI/MecI/CopY family transcriptional regulator [Victivallaceae bacterium]|nr:BlaI/MecI/CopY family transcriptional regulator [Victivallaceae bacterium]
MNKDVRISDAEIEVMKIAWEKNPITSNEIVEKLLQTTSWAPKTIRTLINRLANKGALNYKHQGKGYLYTPGVSKEECVKAETESFLNRMFDGALMPMLTYFAESRKLSSEDIENLKNIIEGNH